MLAPRGATTTLLKWCKRLPAVGSLDPVLSTVYFHGIPRDHLDRIAKILVTRYEIPECRALDIVAMIVAVAAAVFSAAGHRHEVLHKKTTEIRRYMRESRIVKPISLFKAVPSPVLNVA